MEDTVYSWLAMGTKGIFQRHEFSESQSKEDILGGGFRLYTLLLDVGGTGGTLGETGCWTRGTVVLIQQGPSVLTIFFFRRRLQALTCHSLFAIDQLNICM